MRCNDPGEVREGDDLEGVERKGGRGEGVQRHRGCLRRAPGVVHDHAERLVDEQGNGSPGSGLGLADLEVLGEQAGRPLAEQHPSLHRIADRTHDVDRLLIAELPRARAAGELARRPGAPHLVIAARRGLER